jgi:hypothetical protein
LEKGCKKAKMMKETNAISSPTFAPLKFYVPTSFFTYVSFIPPIIGPNVVVEKVERDLELESF